MYGANVLTAKTAEIPSAVISRLDVDPKPMPALWIMLSYGPRALAWAPSLLVSAIERRSAIRTLACGIAFWVVAARSWLRAWRTTVCPCEVRCLAAERPIPSLEPVMKIRAIVCDV